MRSRVKRPTGLVSAAPLISACALLASAACERSDPVRAPGTSVEVGGNGGAGGAGEGGEAGAATSAGGSGAASGGGTGGGGAPGSGGAGGQVCEPLAQAPCYDGAPATEGVGLCIGGTTTCNAQGSAWGACEGQVTPKPEVCATAGDDDCDGLTNEQGPDCACLPGQTKDCYSGPPSTFAIGTCTGGTQSCLPDGNGFGPCEGEVTPQAETCLSPDDEDCDGQSNEEGEGCVCVPGSAKACYEGPDGTEGIGLCASGLMPCLADGTGYDLCAGSTGPTEEICATQGDDDCDGQPNEGGADCSCAPGEVKECYSAPPGTKYVGPCVPGAQLCNADGLGFGACLGEVVPTPEQCATAADEDCDGLVNDGCICVPGAVESCYTGPAGTAGLGACAEGTKTCDDYGTAWLPCQGEVTPALETCLSPADEDCDGLANEEGEGCVCAPGETVACYTGPDGTLGVGACAGGVETCNAEGSAFEPCTGEVTPGIETCLTPGDEDCDGSANEEGEGCTCAPGATQPCYGGAAGTEGVGTCKSGTQTCLADATGWGSCTGEVVPGPENCASAADEACDGPSAVCSGAHAWSKAFGAAGDQAGIAVAVSASGEVVVAGRFQNSVDFGGGLLASAGNFDVFVAKYSASGALQWAKGFGDSAEQQALGVAIDAGGNVVVAGKLQGSADFGGGPLTSAGFYDAFVATFDSLGNPLWSKRFGDAVAQSATAVAVAPSGDIVVTGDFLGSVDFGGGALTSGGAEDAFVAAFTSAGDPLWSKRFGDGAYQSGRSVAVGDTGGVVVTGAFGGTVDFGGGTLTSAGAYDAFVASFDAGGAPLWSKRFGDASSQLGLGVAVTAAGKVVTTGTFSGKLDVGLGPLTSAGGNDVFVAELDAAGTPLWAKRYGSVTDQYAQGVAVDLYGNVAVVGHFAGTVDFGGQLVTSAGGWDAFVVRLDAAGGMLWVKRWGDASDQYGQAIASDAGGSVAAAGYFGGAVDFGGGALTTAGGNDAFLVRLAP